MPKDRQKSANQLERVALTAAGASHRRYKRNSFETQRHRHTQNRTVRTVMIVADYEHIWHLKRTNTWVVINFWNPPTDMMLRYQPDNTVYLIYEKYH